MFPADARSTSAAAAWVPKYHTPSTSSCSASTFTSASFAPVTMLTTPPGTSDASSTVYSSVAASGCASRSEEHTSELQSHSDLVCRLLLEKKKKTKNSRKCQLSAN